jgi:hypothetical protein
MVVRSSVLLKVGPDCSRSQWLLLPLYRVTVPAAWNIQITARLGEPLFQILLTLVIRRLLCDFSLHRLADIKTQNSLTASNTRCCDSAPDKISYPELVRIFYSPGEWALVFADRISKSIWKDWSIPEGTLRTLRLLRYKGGGSGIATFRIKHFPCVEFM